MRRLALSTLSSILLMGCPGGLDNPGAFTGGTGGSSGRTVEAVFEDSCGNAACHDADQPQAGLDLVSPNVASRVVGVNSTGLTCESDIIVIAGDPDESYMMKKILNGSGICGGQMPVLTILDNQDTDVIRQWIMDLGGVPAIINDGPDGGV